MMKAGTNNAQKYREKQNHFKKHKGLRCRGDVLHGKSKVGEATFLDS